MKKLFILLLSLGSGSVVFGQDAAATPGFWDDPFNNPLTPLYLVTALVFVVIVLVMIVALYLLRILNVLVSQTERERVERLGLVYKPQPSMWEKLWQSANEFVPVEQEKKIELDHNYDGIKELDNHLPPWWKWLFYGTIGWSAVYLVLYHVSGTLPLSGEEYDIEVAYAQEEIQRLKAAKPQEAIDESTLAFSNDVAIIANGRAVFISNNCASCHRADGGGNTIGPNLTDGYWIHGGDVKNIFKTVKDGVVEKGMPAWGKVMSPQDVRDVTFYVMSLKGTNPPDAKAPQGDLFKPEPAKTDSTKLQASL